MTDRKIDLSKLSEPFPAEDIEWRVSRAGVSRNGRTFCRVLPYITARAIESRLDAVCGPENWQLTQPIQLAHERKCAIGVGISIRIDGEWITKWDVCELTDSNQNIPPFKGGYSGAVKRAGAQWGIFRYGYYLDETMAEISEQDPGVKGWHWAKLSDKHGGGEYYWKTPQLPAWALPKEAESEVSDSELHTLKQDWRKKFAADCTNRAELAEGFSRFVTSIVGEFPHEDHTCWTKDAVEKCVERINETTDPNDVSADVPFEE